MSSLPQVERLNRSFRGFNHIKSHTRRLQPVALGQLSSIKGLTSILPTHIMQSNGSAIAGENETTQNMK